MVPCSAGAFLEHSSLLLEEGDSVLLVVITNFPKTFLKNELSSKGLMRDSLIGFFEISETDFQIAFRNLIRLNLCQVPAVGFSFIEDKNAKFIRNQIACATEFGIIFVEFCKAGRMKK